MEPSEKSGLGPAVKASENRLKPMKKTVAKYAYLKEQRTDKITNLDQNCGPYFKVEKSSLPLPRYDSIFRFPLQNKTAESNTDGYKKGKNTYVRSTEGVGKKARILTRKGRDDDIMLVIDIDGILGDYPDPSCSFNDLVPRPFFSQFLDFICTNFRVIVWASRSEEELTNTVKKLFGNHYGNLFGVLTREQCSKEYADDPSTINKESNSSIEIIEDGQYLHQYLRPQYLKHRVSDWYLSKNRKSKYRFVRELDVIWETNTPYDFTNSIMIELSKDHFDENPSQCCYNPSPWNKYHVDDVGLSESGEIRVFLDRILKHFRSTGHINLNSLI